MSAKRPKCWSLCIIFMTCYARSGAFTNHNIGRPIRPPTPSRWSRPSYNHFLGRPQPPYPGFYGAPRPGMVQYGPQPMVLVPRYIIQPQYGFPGPESFPNHFQREKRRRPFPKSRTPTGKRSREFGAKHRAKSSRKNRGKSTRKSKKKHQGKSRGRRKRRKNRD